MSLHHLTGRDQLGHNPADTRHVLPTPEETEPSRLRQVSGSDNLSQPSASGPQRVWFLASGVRIATLHKRT